MRREEPSGWLQAPSSRGSSATTDSPSLRFLLVLHVTLRISFLTSFPLLSIPPASNVTTSSGRRRNGVGLGDAVSRQLHHRPVSLNYPTPALPPRESLFLVYSCIHHVLTSPNECLVLSRNAIPRNTGSSVLAAATRNPRLLDFLFFCCASFGFHFCGVSGNHAVSSAS